MKLGVVREQSPGEKRVAVAPANLERLAKQGWEILVETGAGDAAGFLDAAYMAAGARVTSANEVWSTSNVIAKIRAPGADAPELATLHAGQTVICQLFPAQNAALVSRLAAQKVTALALDRIPRITRAQKMDTLSSMSNITGYRAVIEASNQFGRFFTGQITAAGKLAPAKVLIIGAGVAGLAALGAARGLGAIVRAFDTREAVREQVQSLGGEFLTVSVQESGDGGGGYAKEMSQAFLDAEYALFRAQAKEVDIVITTALIPGKPAPKLWLKDMVEMMRPGSVIVDLAAEQGGNCELTRAGEVVTHNGVKIVGYYDFASRMASVASELFGTNLGHFLEELGGAGKWQLDVTNEITRGALVLENGEPRELPPLPAQIAAGTSANPVLAAAGKDAPRPAAAGSTPPLASAPAKAASHGKAGGHGHSSNPTSPATQRVINIIGIIAAVTWLALRFAKPDAVVGGGAFIQHLTVFVLAVFVGWQVVWNVAPALHTPLMSVTNAISGIIIVGGMVVGATANDGLSTAVILAILATFFATINIAGGFLVTRRMLAMFRK